MTRSADLDEDGPPSVTAIPTSKVKSHSGGHEHLARRTFDDGPHRATAARAGRTRRPRRHHATTELPHRSTEHGHLWHLPGRRALRRPAVPRAASKARYPGRLTGSASSAGRRPSTKVRSASHSPCAHPLLRARRRRCAPDRGRHQCERDLRPRARHANTPRTDASTTRQSRRIHRVMSPTHVNRHHHNPHRTSAPKHAARTRGTPSLNCLLSIPTSSPTPPSPHRATVRAPHVA